MDDDHKDNSVGDGLFGSVKDDSCDDEEEEKEYVVKFVYKLEKQYDASKEFNVDTKENVIEEENINVFGCKDDVFKKKDDDGDDGNDDTNHGTGDLGDKLVENIGANKDDMKCKVSFGSSFDDINPEVLKETLANAMKAIK
ncbi:conserved hypothetical protein, partial [Ricinus communis]